MTTFCTAPITRHLLRITIPTHFAKRSIHFFREVEHIQHSLFEIDKQQILKKKYSMSDRVHVRLVASLSVLALIFGILVPLVLLAMPKFEMTSVTAMVLTLTALVFTLGSVLQFGLDAVRPLRVTHQDYVKARWYVPMLRDLDKQKADFNNGGRLDLDYFTNARNSAEKTVFDAAIFDALELFIANGIRYNQTALALNEKVVATIKEDKVFGPATKGYDGNKGGPILYPASFLSAERLAQVMNNFDPTHDFSVESLVPRGSKVELKIPGAVFASRKADLEEALNSVHSLVLQSSEAASFRESQLATEQSSNRLAQELRSAVE